MLSNSKILTITTSRAEILPRYFVTLLATMLLIQVSIVAGADLLTSARDARNHVVRRADISNEGESEPYALRVPPRFS